jgi:hypothetical protein
MGEHVKHHGQTLKLGTCEDLYYVTFEQACQVCFGADQAPGNLPPLEYLNPTHGWRYRFPFPDEDNVEPGSHRDYERGATVGLDWSEDGMTHDTITHSTGDSYNVNIRLPCPATLRKDATLKHSPLPARWPVDIVQQKQMEDGSLWTVCRCHWCGHKFRLPPEEGLKLAQQIKEEHADDPNTFWLEIASRIMAGYLRKTPAVVIK